MGAENYQPTLSVRCLMCMSAFESAGQHKNVHMFQFLAGAIAINVMRRSTNSMLAIGNNVPAPIIAHADCEQRTSIRTVSNEQQFVLISDMNMLVVELLAETFQSIGTDNWRRKYGWPITTPLLGRNERISVRVRISVGRRQRRQRRQTTAHLNDTETEPALTKIH